MSTKRPPAPPPQIRGFTYLSLLGSGGFSDVYLYEQDRPRRKVAVKVLLSGLKTEGARRRFESEANLMAQLSSHPYIVTIYEAEVTEDGHSYLAMEYCSRPSLDARYRRQRFSVDEVLAVGIQVASAVETAHRAGIAHRDIKPANILVTDYNRPALTDFGISGTIGADSDDDAGMSIPWSPPEQFRGGPVDGVLVDVWALGATLYTLLAGRSPFVMPGQDNSQRELISRITNSPVPRLGRADVPESLELALATAMAKSPGSRYSSAHAFALALQRIQAELNLSVTPFEVLDEQHQGDEPHPDDGVEETRVRSIASIDPDGGTGSTGSGTTGSGTTGRGFTGSGGGLTGSRSGLTGTAPTFPARTFPSTRPFSGNVPAASPRQDATAQDAAAQDATAQDVPLHDVPLRDVPAGAGTGDSSVEDSQSTVLRSWVPKSPAPAAPESTAPAPGAPSPNAPAPETGGTRQTDQDATKLRSSALAGTGLAHTARGPGGSGLAEPDLAETVNRPVAQQEPGDVRDPSDHRKRNIWLAATGAAVLAVAVVVGVALGAGAPAKVQPTEQVSKPPADALDSGSVPDVAGLAGKRTAAGKVLFTWTNPQPKAGDTFKWRVKTAKGGGTYASVAAGQVEVNENPAEPTCIQVIIVRSDGTASPEGEGSIACLATK